MNCQKTFLLGVGCQKGGTTWLHSQLETYENVDLGFCKEYHFFDTYYLKSEFARKQRWLILLKDQLSKKPQKLPNKSILRRLLFAQDENSYYQYFNNLWSSDDKISIVGDITPSYNALKAEHFSVIKKKLEDLGFTVKIIFFMRDPVERIWSSVRMYRRNKIRKGAFVKKSDNDLLLSQYKLLGVSQRTRYDLTILNLEQVFNSSNIFYCLYEDLFSIESTDKLQNFLCLKENKFNIYSRKNVSPKEQTVDILTKREVARHYREVYDFVIKRFPVDDRWSNYKLLKD